MEVSGKCFVLMCLLGVIAASRGRDPIHGLEQAPGREPGNGGYPGPGREPGPGGEPGTGLQPGHERRIPVQALTPSRSFYDMKVDLSSGLVSGSDSSISWHSRLAGSGRCGKRGVLKLRFNSAGLAKRKVRIDMVFSTPRKITFNIGDSRTNNGYGGDAATQSRDAEIFSYNTALMVHSNDHHRPAGHRYVRKNIIGTETNILQFVITDGVITWNNGNSYFNTIAKNDLFALKGQRDTEGRVNYDIYLGMNRVIAGDYRKGTGLCSVGIKWLDGFA